jgi:hypothetical protein
MYTTFFLSMLRGAKSFLKSKLIPLHVVNSYDRFFHTWTITDKNRRDANHKHAVGERNQPIEDEMTYFGTSTKLHRSYRSQA